VVGCVATWVACVGTAQPSTGPLLASVARLARFAGLVLLGHGHRGATAAVRSTAGPGDDVAAQWLQVWRRTPSLRAALMMRLHCEVPGAESAAPQGAPDDVLAGTVSQLIDAKWSHAASISVAQFLRRQETLHSYEARTT
jgi:hypothetical protein